MLHKREFQNTLVRVQKIYTLLKKNTDSFQKCFCYVEGFTLCVCVCVCVYVCVCMTLCVCV